MNDTSWGRRESLITPPRAAIYTYAAIALAVLVTVVIIAAVVPAAALLALQNVSVAHWAAAQSRMEMHLESVCEQDVYIPALKLRVGFTAGERIHTENSYKYTPATVARLIEGAFRLERSWTDQRGWFSLHLARAI